MLVHNARPMHYLDDFQTDRTKQARGVFGSEGEARNYARQRLGQNPVDIGDNKIRSIDGRWQYRAKPDDVIGAHGKGPHVHLEELNVKTGEEIKNFHLYFPPKIDPQL